MSAHLKPAKAAALRAAAAAIAFALPSAAMADVQFDFSIVTNQFSKPSMTFTYKDGKYVWKEEDIVTAAALNGDTGKASRTWEGGIALHSAGLGPSKHFAGSLPGGGNRTWSWSGPITFPIQFLKSYEAGFAAWCDASGGKRMIKDGVIPFTVIAGYFDKSKEPSEVTGPTTLNADSSVSRVVQMPVVIACEAKPPGRPDSVKHEKGPIRAQSVGLRFMTFTHAVSRPNPATVCKKALVSVTVQTNQAGPVRARLHTKIGDGQTTTKLIEAWAKHDGSGKFFANHKEWIEVTRSTSVQAMAEEMVNPIGLTTQWKSISLHCTGAGGGGFAGTPSNANPDARLPSARQHAFDGPKGVVRLPTIKPTRPETVRSPRPAIVQQHRRPTISSPPRVYRLLDRSAAR